MSKPKTKQAKSGTNETSANTVTSLKPKKTTSSSPQTPAKATNTPATGQVNQAAKKTKAKGKTTQLIQTENGATTQKTKKKRPRKQTHSAGSKPNRAK